MIELQINKQAMGICTAALLRGPMVELYMARTCKWGVLRVVGGELHHRVSGGAGRRGEALAGLGRGRDRGPHTGVGRDDGAQLLSDGAARTAYAGSTGGGRAHLALVIGGRVALAGKLEATQPASAANQRRTRRTQRPMTSFVCSSYPTEDAVGLY